MTFILTLFAGVIAFGVIYNSARIALSERDRELASLRVLGLTRGEIAYILLGELALLTLAAVPVGLAPRHAGRARLPEERADRPLPVPVHHRPAHVRPRRRRRARLRRALSALIVRFRLDRLDLIGVLKTRE